MRFLDLTLATAVENLALDEALLQSAEASAEGAETLRLWEPPEMMVVVGRSSRVTGEVRLEACRRLGVPVLRRPSGGAAVVAGPGCLMYSLVLSYRRRPHLRAVDRAHRHVLGQIAAALRPHWPEAEHRGTSDLCWGLRKFSGNSLRCQRDWMLYHGTLLYDFPLESVGRLLRTPPRMPEYRGERSHRDFLVNLPLEAGVLRAALRQVFGAESAMAAWPEALTRRLAEEKYSRPAWNEKR